MLFRVSRFEQLQATFTQAAGLHLAFRISPFAIRIGRWHSSAVTAMFAFQAFFLTKCHSWRGITKMSAALYGLQNFLIIRDIRPRVGPGQDPSRTSDTDIPNSFMCNAGTVFRTSTNGPRREWTSDQRATVKQLDCAETRSIQDASPPCRR